MAAKAKKKTLQLVGKKKCNLKKYKRRSMYCPVEGKMVEALGIPLSEIHRSDLNPGRPEGTDQANVNSIFHKLITDPEGQREPCSAQWDTSLGMWDMVFGWNRYDGFEMAQEAGMDIASSPDYELWVLPFSGTAGARGRKQLRENANKDGGKESTAPEVATMLAGLARVGEMDKPGSPFAGCSDKDKRARCLEVVKTECPQWGGHKFKTVWKFLGNKNGATNTLGLNYKQWPKKYELSQYFIAHNPWGITDQDVIKSVDKDKSHSGIDANGDAYFKSGFYLDKNGTRFLFYIALNKSEMAGGLPTNATKARIKTKADHVIVLVASNKAGSTGVVSARNGFAAEGTWWNTNVMRTFDELYFIPATAAEVSNDMVKGKWSRHDKL
jgi:hypothetical protein